MAPGEQHKQLARMSGDWTFTQKFWMAPGQPPGESSGTMHADVLLGGRYVEHSWHGSFMGMPFEGRGTEAYDNVGKQYVSSWYAGIIDLVVILDATALALAICVTIGRGYFALGRDGSVCASEWARLATCSNSSWSSCSSRKSVT